MNHFHSTTTDHSASVLSRNSIYERHMPAVHPDARSWFSMSYTNGNTLEDHQQPSSCTVVSHQYLKVLSTIFPNRDSILTWKQPKPDCQLMQTNNRRNDLFQSNLIKQHQRRNVTQFYQCLEAPLIENDFYLSNFAWSSQNVIAIVLDDTVMMKNQSSIDQSRRQAVGSGRTPNSLSDNAVVEISSFSSKPTSLAFSPTSGDSLAIGTSDGQLEIRDVRTTQLIATYTATYRGENQIPRGRISCLSWNPTQPHLISVGNSNGIVSNFDCRTNATLACFQKHQQEVCGLQWSPDGQELASGGNDNLICIWSFADRTSYLRKELSHHQSAVKAVAWSPHSTGILATGGGRLDRRLNIWDTKRETTVLSSSRNRRPSEQQTMITNNRDAIFSTESSPKPFELILSVQTDSPISGIEWSHHSPELVTAHGCPQSHVARWMYSGKSRKNPHHFLPHPGSTATLVQQPMTIETTTTTTNQTEFKHFFKLEQFGHLSDHRHRILNLVQSPDHSNIAYSCSDERIMFWKIWSPENQTELRSSSHQNQKETTSSYRHPPMMIR